MGTKEGRGEGPSYLSWGMQGSGEKARVRRGWD